MTDRRGEDSSGILPADTDFDKPMVVWRWVRDQCQWPMREKMAYLMLYSRRGMDGQNPYPGLGRLAEDMGTAYKASLAAVRQLQELQALRIQPRRVEGRGDRDTHVYEVLPPWSAVQECRPALRGRHKCSDGDGVGLKQPNVESKQPNGRVKMTQGVGLKQPINKPREQAKRKSQSINASRSAVSEETQAIVIHFNSLLTENGLPSLTGQAWGAARRMAGNALAGGSGPAVPVEEAVLALSWGMTDEYWRRRLASGGLKALRDVWAAWRERDKQTTRQGRRGRYVDPAASGPQFDPNSPWGRTYAAAQRGETDQ